MSEFEETLKHIYAILDEMSETTERMSADIKKLREYHESHGERLWFIKDGDGGFA